MAGVKIGNYVEIKNSTLGPGTKSAHLTYIGDADVGADVNFGCGSVIVNYDGYAKHRTRVGDAAFVGCNVNLLAPVEVAARSFTAAGSTISLDVPEDALGVARARQRNIEGWVARKEGRGAARVATAKPKRSAKKRAAKKKTAKNGAAKRRPAKQAGRKPAPKRKAAHKRR